MWLVIAMKSAHKNRGQKVHTPQMKFRLKLMDHIDES